MLIAHHVRLACPAALAAGLLLSLVLAVPGPAATEDLQRTPEELDAHIQALIEQLGAPQYLAREKAQAELEQLGLVAFDSLYEAQNHGDIEVALRARYLVRSLQVSWVRPDDPMPVQKILRDYGEKSENERPSLMEQLAALDDGQGVAPLCRLVRFEPSNRLSKRAALTIINQLPPEDEMRRSQLARTLGSAVGLSKRIAAQWVRTYAQSLDNPEAALPQWQSLVESERLTLTEFPEKSSPEIARDLLRFHAEQLRRLNRDEESLAVIRQTFELLDGTREQLLDMASWLIQREAWSLVDELARQFAAEFEKTPLLMYRLAEAQLKQGRDDEAQQTAQRALQMIREQPEEHIEAGEWLQERGMFEWSEREYRLVMQLEPMTSLHHLRARFRLAEMLHDSGHDQAAAQVLDELVQGMEKDPTVEKMVRARFRPVAGSVRARMHFFQACHCASRSDHKSELEHLEKAAENDARDADVLIAMYRARDVDNSWREKTRQHIRNAVEHFRNEINMYSQQMSQAEQLRNEPLVQWATYQLASANNQLAWLVANTEGDFDEALRCSQKSLELLPDSAGYLDTLAHCYYAKDDYDNAVKFQTRAAKLEPYSGQIQRKLEFFQQAQADRQRAGGERSQPEVPDLDR